tara:strand:+ start:543 stop:752 length:210 start_codon:yes stop_codon:yes gene_type:complete
MIDWYSDESDEAFEKEKEDKMYEEMQSLNEDIIDLWEFIKEKTIKVKIMEAEYRILKQNWNQYWEGAEE